MIIGKIVKDHEELKKIIIKHKSQGERVVFTNGCFNILHVGHIRSFQNAKDLGDILVVAVNDDTSVRLLKGDNYPVIPDDERMEILSAITYIDYLTFFSGHTVDDLLLALQPDIHAKGTDYSVNTVPERETVLSYGGKIAIVGDPKSHSSTEIMKKILDF